MGSGDQVALAAEAFVYGFPLVFDTPGLHTAEDGSLTIVMQRDEPSTPAGRANWLPTPAGDFRPLLRMYEPDGAVFDGSFELPPITRWR